MYCTGRVWGLVVRASTKLGVSMKVDRGMTGLRCSNQGFMNGLRGASCMLYIRV